MFIPDQVMADRESLLEVFHDYRHAECSEEYLALVHPLPDNIKSFEEVDERNADILLDHFDKLETVQGRDGVYQLHGVTKAGERTLLTWFKH